MSRETFRKHKKLYITLITLAAVLLIAFAACAIYVGDYYRTDAVAANAAPFGEGVTVRTMEDGDLLFEPTGTPVAGLIFYPGGKVEHTAYAPLMKALAERGILCVLVEMPFRLAVLDMSAADGIPAHFPHVERWYVGGHSLGGSMAASYLSDNAADFEGLILLGAYSTADLSGTALAVLSVYGSNDGVLNREKYAECKQNLPADHTEYVIEGGNHAGFGYYGPQSGDGAADLTPAEQITATADRIAALVRP